MIPSAEYLEREKNSIDHTHRYRSEMEKFLIITAISEGATVLTLAIRRCAFKFGKLECRKPQFSAFTKI
jgi:hypothetical protein